MLKGELIHPEILSALGQAGHGSQVLIADRNYPFLTGSAPSARRVYLNLSPGIVSATDVLRVLVQAIPVEGAAVMQPESGAEPPIFDEFRSLLPAGLEIKPLNRFEFYYAARSPSTALVIATAEQRVYGNLLLTVGVVTPNA